MPYIKPEDRDRSTFQPETAGELNFMLTERILYYLGPHPNYQKYNDVLGVLTAIQLELYRRKIASYEDTKIIENGDVY